MSVMWFIKRVKLDGWDTGRAMKEAEAIGLRFGESQGLRALVRRREEMMDVGRAQ